MNIILHVLNPAVRFINRNTYVLNTPVECCLNTTFKLFNAAVPCINTIISVLNSAVVAFANLRVGYTVAIIYVRSNSKSSPVTDLEWPRGFQEFKVPRFDLRKNGNTMKQCISCL